MSAHDPLNTLAGDHGQHLVELPDMPKVNALREYPGEQHPRTRDHPLVIQHDPRGVR